MSFSAHVQPSMPLRFVYGAVAVVGLVALVFAMVWAAADPVLALQRLAPDGHILPGGPAHQLIQSLAPAAAIFGLLALAAAIVGLFPATGEYFAQRPLGSGVALLAVAVVTSAWLSSLNVVNRETECWVVLVAHRMAGMPGLAGMVGRHELPTHEGLAPLVPVLVRLSGGWTFLVAALGGVSTVLGAGLLVLRGARRTDPTAGGQRLRAGAGRIPPGYALAAMGLVLLADPLRVHALELTPTLVAAGLAACTLAAAAWGRPATAGCLAALALLSDWSLGVTMLLVAVMWVSTRRWTMLLRYAHGAGVTLLPFAGWFLFEYGQPFHPLLVAWRGATANGLFGGGSFADGAIPLLRTVIDPSVYHLGLAVPAFGLTVPVLAGAIACLVVGIVGCASKRGRRAAATTAERDGPLDPPQIRLMTGAVVLSQLLVAALLSPAAALDAGLLMLPIALAALVLSVRPAHRKLGPVLPLAALMIGGNLMVPLHSYLAANDNYASPVRALTQPVNAEQIRKEMAKARQDGAEQTTLYCDDYPDALLVMATLKVRTARTPGGIGPGSRAKWIARAVPELYPPPGALRLTRRAFDADHELGKGYDELTGVDPFIRRWHLVRVGADPSGGPEAPPSPSPGVKR